jgi:hypoxanthine phosphoribosyltransferase
MPEFEVLLSQEKINERVSELGAQLTRDYAGEELHAVAVLKGSYVFLADLLRAIDLPVHVHFLGVKSYVGTESTGEVQITHDLDATMEGKNVLVVEDIVDTGLTLKYLVDTMGARHPRSLKIAALLDKPSRRQADVEADYIGFSIPDKFVVGYGLDHDGLYRNLDHVAVYSP